MNERLRAIGSRLPLRVRLVSGFSVAMLLGLSAAGGFVYWRVEYALDRGLDTELTQASQALIALVDPDGSVDNRAAADATGVAWQILTSSGMVRDHGGPVRRQPMVGPGRLTAAPGSSATYNVGEMLPISAAPFRLRVTALSGHSGRYLVVAIRRDHRDEALRELLVQLTVAGVAMLAFTALVGERLARAALQPVERYRRTAEAIAAGATELRLDVPVDRDDEVTRLGHTFNAMLASLARALERERRFINDASHELRTPITLLRSRIQLARRRPRSTEEYEHTLDELEVDVDRLASLAEHLLDVGSAGENAGVQPSDLTAVARRAVDDLRTAGDADELIVSIPKRPIEVTMGPIDLARVVTNLLDNAHAHGAEPVTLAVDLATPLWARIVVTDTGPGMPADFLPTATRRFARADPARSSPGSGLGLALVEALVTKAGGSLRLCQGGDHIVFGRTTPIECDHGPAMTVTVLLPVSSG